MLTRTGYLVTEGPIAEIKKELTVRPQVNGDYGFPPPPSKFLEQLRMECAFQDSTELLGLENPRRTGAQNQPGLRLNLLDNSETPPIRTPHLLRLLVRVMEFSHSHAGMERPPYPWQ